MFQPTHHILKQQHDVEHQRSHNEHWGHAAYSAFCLQGGVGEVLDGHLPRQIRLCMSKVEAQT